MACLLYDNANTQNGDVPSSETQWDDNAVLAITCTAWADYRASNAGDVSKHV
jgi:hypothetical protein